MDRQGEGVRTIDLHDPTIQAALDRAARRYRACGRFARHYVASKLARDPVHTDILDLASRERFGHVIDVGCGRGQLAVALLEARLADSVGGIDWNAAHLAQAERAAQGLAFSAAHVDVGQSAAIPETDTVILVDVLYQLATDHQTALLRACAAAARGKILVRTLDPGQGSRSRLTETLERIGKRIWPHSGAEVNAQPVEVLASVLVSAGFEVTQAPCWRGTPFANVLMVARRVRSRAV